METIEHIIEHKTETKYGYLYWGPGRNEEYKRVIPSKKRIDAIFLGEKVPYRNVEWKYGRMHIGASMKKLAKGTKLNLYKKNNLLYIEKA